MLDLCEGLTEIQDREGNKLHFSKIINSKFLICRYKQKQEFDEQICKIKKLRTKNIPQGELEKVNIWSNLPLEIQQTIQQMDNEQVQKQTKKMDNVRSKKRSKYSDIPKTLKCTKCNKTVDQAPSYTAAICRKQNLTVQDYINKFECRICSPRKRGRKIDPKYAHLPKKIELKCNKNCGYKRTISRSYLVNELKRKKMQSDEYLKTYICQNCNPTKGRKKKTKK